MNWIGLTANPHADQHTEVLKICSSNHRSYPEEVDEEEEDSGFILVTSLASLLGVVGSYSQRFHTMAVTAATMLITPRKMKDAVYVW